MKNLDSGGAPIVISFVADRGEVKPANFMGQAIDIQLPMISGTLATKRLM